MTQRHSYHDTRSQAASSVATATLVSSTHSTGSTPAGASPPPTYTPHNATGFFS
jgi:hypothetical protein